ncbi:MAG: hypothetical protein ACMVO3_10400 [Thalassobaculum sp.]
MFRKRSQIDWTLPMTVRRLMTLTGRYAAAEIATRRWRRVGIASPSRCRGAVRFPGANFSGRCWRARWSGRPDLLILDEPVQGVDFTGEVTLYALIKADPRRDRVRHSADLPRPACGDGGNRQRWSA